MPAGDNRPGDISEVKFLTVAEVAAIEKKCAQGTAEDQIAEIDLPLMQMAAGDPVDDSRSH